MSYEYEILNVKVIDGDTIKCDIDCGLNIVLKNQTVRIFGVDCPESRTTDLTEKKYGLLAKSHIKEFIRLYNPVLIVQSTADKYGRLLGDLKSGELTASQSLIDNHLAVAYFGKSKDEIRNQHITNREILDGL